jgi:hypothetical protein
MKKFNSILIPILLVCAFIGGLMNLIAPAQAGKQSVPQGTICSEPTNTRDLAACLNEAQRQISLAQGRLLTMLEGSSQPIAQPQPPAQPVAAKSLKFLHPQAVASNGYSCVGLPSPEIYVSCLEQMAQGGSISTKQMVQAIQLLAAQQGVQAMEGPVVDLKAGQAYYIWAPSGIQEGTPDLARPLFGTRASEFSNNVFNAAVANSRKVSASGPHALWVIPTE